jgi:hypothetical protein
VSFEGLFAGESPQHVDGLVAGESPLDVGDGNEWHVLCECGILGHSEGWNWDVKAGF